MIEIAGVKIDTEAQRKNTAAERAYIFAHLSGLEKTKAIQELEKAMAEKPAVKAQEAPKIQDATKPADPVKQG
jgi:hypothetical protein